MRHVLLAVLLLVPVAMADTSVGGTDPTSDQSSHAVGPARAASAYIQCWDLRTDIVSWSLSGNGETLSASLSVVDRDANAACGYPLIGAAPAERQWSDAYVVMGNGSADRYVVFWLDNECVDFVNSWRGSVCGDYAQDGDSDHWSIPIRGTTSNGTPYDLEALRWRVSATGQSLVTPASATETAVQYELLDYSQTYAYFG